MDEPRDGERNVTLVAVLFEGGLALVALAIGWVVGHWPLESVQWTSEKLPGNGIATLVGLAAVAPLAVGLLVVNRFPIGPFSRLKEIVDRVVVPLFSRTTVFELAMISLVAGIGEELLCRGLIQEGLSKAFGPPYGIVIGLAVGSIIFGACHWITRTYAILATLVGVYFGLLFILTGNLLAPVVAHAAYDFCALVYLVKWSGAAGPPRIEKGGPIDVDQAALDQPDQPSDEERDGSD